MLGSVQPCTVCHGQIFGGSMKIGSLYYHQKCFSCVECGVRLQMSTYKVNKERLFCDGCYKKVFLRNVDTSADAAPMGLSSKQNQDATSPTRKSPPKTDSFQTLQRQYPTTPAPAASVQPPPQPQTATRKFCHLCGHALEIAGAKFCTSCGGSLA